MSLSDRLAVMSEGRIRQFGTPEEIYRRPCDRFVASFVGDANVLRGRLDGLDGAHAVVAVGAARVKVPASPLRGVRPSAPVLRKRVICPFLAAEFGSCLAAALESGDVNLSGKRDWSS